MITLEPLFGDNITWAQNLVANRHYLRKSVDVRSRPFGYRVNVSGYPAGCLIFGRPEASRCYDGNLTYGSQEDVQIGRARFDRWSVLNLARVWLDPEFQPGGYFYDNRPDVLPGYTDRRGVWRSTLASTVIRTAMVVVGFDYLRAHPPVDCDYPYQIEAVLSYCDLSKHRGTIYRAAGFTLARRNDRGIETWFTTDVCPLSDAEDAAIRRAAESSARSRRIRAQRAQLELAL